MRCYVQGMTTRAPRPPPAAIRHGGPWRVRLLGGVTAQTGTTTLSRWPSRAVGALLARLALAPQRMHPREELVELLWPGVSLERGRPRLRQALSVLRSLLEPAGSDGPAVLLADRHSVRLNPQAIDCDVLQFERDLAAGDLEGARACHAGDFMPGYYDDWIVAERHRLVALLESVPSLGRPHQPTLTPTASPPPSTPAPAAADASAASASLPSYWTRAFGQDSAVQQLASAVRLHRLVTVLGPGGNGKTRLAVATGQTLAEQRPPAHEQLVFVPLVDAVDPAAVWNTLALALGCHGHGEPARRVQAWISARRVLLILDNVEQLNGEATMVLAQLLRDGAGLHLLLTSRSRTGLAGEQVFEMPGLQVPDETAAARAAAADAAATDIRRSLADNPAVALFVDRARESRPEFHLTAQNAAAVCGLVRLLGGMPLAIELAASRLRALQPHELLARLHDEAGSPLLDLLAKPRAASSARSRHASMRHVIRWSWQQLPQPVADLLRAMAVFAAPASLQALAQALGGLHDGKAGAAEDGGDTEPGPAPALSVVQALIADAMDASLIQVSTAASPSPAPAAGEPSLYRLLPPVREYAAEQSSPEALRVVRSRLRRWLAACAREGLPRQRPSLQADLSHAWALLLRARDDLAPREALALAVPMQGEWAWRPSLPAVQQVLLWALGRHAPDAPDALVSQGHYVMAALRQLQADPAQASVHAEQAVATAPDDRCRSLALSLRAWIGLQGGAALSVVQPALDEALALARRCGDGRAEALILRLQASLQLNHFEDYAAAARLLEVCVRMFEQQGNVAQACNRQSELAVCWDRTGRPQAGLALAKTCLQRCDALGLAMIRIYALTSLGIIQLRQRDPQAAREALEQATRLALQDDWPALLLPALLPLPEAWLRCGQAEAAALLLGHVCARWPASLGRFNRVDVRTVRRTRRLLGLALGSRRAAALRQAGAVLAQDRVLQPMAATPPAGSALRA
jgi:predicted ATPase